jgi:hypothetical protein
MGNLSGFSDFLASLHAKRQANRVPNVRFDPEMPELIEDRGDFFYETAMLLTECRDFRQYLDKCRGSSTLGSRPQFETKDALSVPKNTGRRGLHKTT